MTLILRNNTFSVFIPIHHSFGFFDIVLEGGLKTPKTPWIHP